MRKLKCARRETKSVLIFMESAESLGDSMSHVISKTVCWHSVIFSKKAVSVIHITDNIFQLFIRRAPFYGKVPFSELRLALCVIELLN